MDYEPNTSSPRERADYGVKVARAGFDTKNAKDNQLLYNSSWPILQIVKMIRTDSDATEVTIDGRPWKRWLHGLGYPPAFITPNNTSNFETSQARYQIGVDEHYLYIDTELDVAHFPLVMITQINLLEDVDYPYTDDPLMLGYEEVNYGMKTTIHQNMTSVVGMDTSMVGYMALALKTEKTCVPLQPDNLYTIRYVFPEKMKALMVLGYKKEMDTGLWRRLGYAVQSVGELYLRNEEEVQVFVGAKDAGGNWLYGGEQSAVLILRSPFVSPDVEVLTV